MCRAGSVIMAAPPSWWEQGRFLHGSETPPAATHLAQQKLYTHRCTVLSFSMEIT